jgi:hypothetical protein
MSTIMFKVPKDEMSYRGFLIKYGIEVIRDRLPVKRPLIIEGDGIRIKHNGCVCRVMHIHHKKDKNYYIVVMANKCLSFNDLVVNNYPILDAMCKDTDIDNYYKS